MFSLRFFFLLFLEGKTAEHTAEEFQIRGVTVLTFVFPSDLKIAKIQFSSIVTPEPNDDNEDECIEFEDQLVLESSH